MIILPAIDIRKGQCVRLTKGDFSQVKIYDKDPKKMAKRFEEEGASFVHLIDLDGADSKRSNKELIKEIASSLDVPVQVGGGIRDLKTIKDLLNSDINRIILGTMPFRNKEDFLEAVKTYKERIVVSLDCDQESIKINGWKEDSKINLFDFVKELEDLGLTTLVVTDIAKDGMLEGPNLDLYRRLAQTSSLNIIASGGVTSLEDIEALAKLGLYGAIIGKSLYEEQISLKEAILCSQNASSLV